MAVASDAQPTIWVPWQRNSLPLGGVVDDLGTSSDGFR